MRDFFFERVCSFPLFQKYIDENDALPEKAQEKVRVHTGREMHKSRPVLVPENSIQSKWIIKE